MEVSRAAISMPSPSASPKFFNPNISNTASHPPPISAVTLRIMACPSSSRPVVTPFTSMPAACCLISRAINFLARRSRSSYIGTPEFAPSRSGP